MSVQVWTERLPRPCPVCREWIRSGDRVVVVNDESVHVECEDPEAEIARAEREAQVFEQEELRAKLDGIADARQHLRQAQEDVFRVEHDLRFVARGVALDDGRFQGRVDLAFAGDDWSLVRAHVELGEPHRDYYVALDAAVAAFAQRLRTVGCDEAAE